MENTYWARNGKHQALVDGLNELVPLEGYTDNPYMNLFLAVSHLYYDAHNNGGGNIEDCYRKDFEQYIKPYLSVDINDFSGQRESVMEAAMDRTLELIFEHNVTYQKYPLWVDYDGRRVSLTKKNGLLELTFGKEETRDSYRQALTADGFSDMSDKAGLPPQPMILTRLELAEMQGEKIRVHYIGACSGFYEDETVSYYGELEQGVVLHDHKLQATSLSLRQYGSSWTATLADQPEHHSPVGKLVRDKIPDIILSNGDNPQTRTLSDTEFQFELDRKLQEETIEYLDSHELLELADILEVLYAIAEASGASRLWLESLRASKHSEHGGFSKKVFLCGVTEGKAKLPHCQVLLYETGIEHAEVLGSESTRENVFSSRDEAEAFKAFRLGGRNYLSRTVKRDEGIYTEYYDGYTKSWKP